MTDDRDAFAQHLWADYASENLETMRSYAVSASEALTRGNFKTAHVFFSCLRLAGKETAEAFKHLPEVSAE